jgi:hypothetical protein
MYRKLLFFLFLLLPLSLLSQTVTLDLVVEPYPTPYISEWQDNPGIITLSLTNNESSVNNITLFAKIIKGEEILASGYSDNIELAPLDVRILDNTDFISWVEGNYQENLADQIKRTGRLPEGRYRICVERRSGGVTIDEVCAECEIIIPAPPDLLNPMDETNVTDEYPQFEWTPVFMPSALNIQYRLKICEITEGEDENYAITKVPIWEEITNSTYLLYPSSAPILDIGKNYVWQVQLLDENDNPLGENEGKSEIWSFIYQQEAVSGEISGVNDGEGDDIDWTRDSTIVGNWSGTGANYYYCVGNTAGSDNIIPWRYANDSTQFSINNILPEGSEYFVSVKSGENGEVMSSDGCRIDRTPAASSVKPLPDSVDINFTVSWAGSDNLSGIKAYNVQYKKEDSVFVDWKTTSDTSSSFTGMPGKKYYFRASAIDNAANEEAWPDGADDSTLVKTGSDSIYILVPDVAYLKVTDSTEVNTKKDTTTLKGKAKLVIIPEPFNNYERTIELTKSSSSQDSSSKSKGIAFYKDNVINKLVPVSGSFTISDTSGIKKVYKDVLKITNISFDSKREAGSKLMVDSSYVQFPFNIPSLNNTNLFNIDSLPITGAGIAFNKSFNKEFSKWGMSFTFKQFFLAVDESPPFIKAKFNMAFNKKGKDKKVFASDATLGFRGKDDIYAKVVPDTVPWKLIPNKDYVLMDSLWFLKESEDWKLGVGLKFRYPPPLNKVADTTAVNMIIGDDGFDLTLDVFKEARTDSFSSKNDYTAFEICKYLKVDIAQLRLKLVSENQNDKVELDEEHSYIEIMADLYVGEKTPKRIAIGDSTHNGLRISFDGDFKKPDIDADVIKNPIDIGPINISELTLGIDFDPFFLSFSGQIGVNKEDVFSGSVLFENLKIGETGLDMSEFMVLGGDLEIMSILGVSIGEIEFSDSPSTISFKEPGGDSTIVQTINVDSYFRLGGASLSLNLGSSNSNQGGGGGFEDLLLYKVAGSTSFILADAWFEVANTCRLSADLKYIEDPEPLLTFGGGLRIHSSGIEGAAFGKIGERGGQPTFGIFLAASGLNINLGTVTLDDLGGGFFYRPLQSDIDQVRSLCSIKKPEMGNDISAIMQERIPPAPDLTFAVMLYAGMYVGSKEILDAHALITLTSNYFELLANAKMMKNQADGKLSLFISWAPKYAEGDIEFKMGVEKIIDVNQQIEFFVYSSEVTGNGPIWAVMGNGNVRIFPGFLETKLSTEFFLGPPGFFFEVEVEKHFNFWIIKGGYEFGTMFWWERGVSWGAYAHVYGELELDHVLGIGAGLEGALIGAQSHIFIYSVGSINVKLLGETVYKGSLWVSLGSNGMHGGKGRNSTYDGYIESAKNMADDMKEELENLAEQIEEAKLAAMELTDEQRLAAGSALYQIISGGNIFDLLYVGASYINDLEYGEPNPVLTTVFDQVLFHNDIKNLKNIRENIEQDTVVLDQKLQAIIDKSNAVKASIGSFSSRVSGELPQIAEELMVSNPVDTGNVTTISVNGNTTTIPVGGSINTQLAQQNSNSAQQMREDISAYKDSLINQANGLIDDLVFADSVVYLGNNSVKSLCLDYYFHTQDITKNTISYIDYFKRANQLYLSRWGTMANNQSTIYNAVESQTAKLSESQIESLIRNREAVINFLLRKAGEPEDDPYDFSGKTLAEKQAKCNIIGKEVWFNIPLAGINSMQNQTEPQIQSLIGKYASSRNNFFQKWADFSTGIEEIHNVKAGVYEYLYDLYDDLSWEYENGGPQKQMVEVGGEISPQGFEYGGQVYQQFAGYQQSGQSTYTGYQYSGQGSQLLLQPGISKQGSQQASQLTQQIGQGTQQSMPQFGESALQVEPSMLFGLDIGSTAKEIKSFETYSEKREYIGGILVPPTITNLLGTFSSTENSRGYYGILTLEYEATHPSEGGCLYAVDIPGYTNGSCGIGIGKTPSYYFFKNEFPAGNYTAKVTAFSNPGYQITRSGSFSAGYFSLPDVDTQTGGGPYNSTLSSVDNTKPSVPQFSNTIYSIKENEIHFSYNSIDNESGIQEYKYAVIDSLWYEFITLAAPPVRHYHIAKSWESTGGRKDITVRNLDFEHGNTFNILGKAKNGAGMWSSEGVSAEIVVDTSGPSDITIQQFAMNTMGAHPDTSYQLIAEWTASTDNETNVVYAFGIGKQSGTDDIYPFTVTNARSLDMVIATNAPPSGTVYLTVKAINGTGLSKTDTKHIYITPIMQQMTPQIHYQQGMQQAVPQNQQQQPQQTVPQTQQQQQSKSKQPEKSSKKKTTKRR